MTKVDQANKESKTELEDLLLGQIFKEKREKLKLEIEDVSRFLRVREEDIRAFESNNFFDVGKHIYLTGFIRSYARFLKIDTKPIESKIKFLPKKCNIDDAKHRLLNIGEDVDLSPGQESVFNFALILFLLFFILLSTYNFFDNRDSLINFESIIKELNKL